MGSPLKAETCVICLESLAGSSDAPTVLLTTQCQHSFHALCLHRWLGKIVARGSCPLCRQLARPLRAPLSNEYRYDITECIQQTGILENTDWHLVDLKLYDVLELTDVVSRILVECIPGRSRLVVVFKRSPKSIACVAPLERIEGAIKDCNDERKVRSAVRKLKLPPPLTTFNVETKDLAGRVVRDPWEWVALAVLTRLWSTLEADLTTFVWEARPFIDAAKERPDILGYCCWAHYPHRLNPLSSYGAIVRFEDDEFSKHPAHACFGCPLCSPACSSLNDDRFEYDD